MILRIRSQLGIWRVNDVKSSTSMKEIREILSREHNIDLSDGNLQPITLGPGKSATRVQSYDTISGMKLKHGDMLYLQLDESKLGLIHEETNGPKRINADGIIVQQSYEEISRKTGFRPGRLSLKDIKMKWTLADFMEMDDQYTFKIKRQEKTCCESVTLDTTSCNSFQSYVRQFGFHQSRVAFLYGKIDRPTNKVKVECMYEPPQENSSEGFILLDDPKEEVVETLANYLGLERVGWIFAHPPREEGFQFNGAEVIMASELQLIAADGVHDHPFVTVKVTIDSKGDAHFDAFQVSKQCMEMVAEDALKISHNPAYCKVSDSFTAIVEAKATPEVDNNFFLVVVPIEQHESESFINFFPPCNRHGVAQTWAAVKQQLSRAGSQGFTYVDMLSDFHLLLFLTEFLDMKTDLPKICHSVTDRTIPLDEGFKLIINHMAGMEN